MQKPFHVLLLIVFISCFADKIYAQAPGDKLIPNDKLKWEYYTGKPDSVSGYWSSTYWNVFYHYKIVSLHVDTVKVSLQLSHFLRADSWVLPDKESDELLHHEQGHFDLAIVFEIKFRQAIDTTTLLFANYDKKIDSVYHAVLDNIKDMNVQYDKETNHMWNKEEQNRWDDKIAAMMKE
jgi:hypothetical protein